MQIKRGAGTTIRLVTDSELTEDVLRKLEALVEAATPGPWEAFLEEHGGLAGCSFIRMGSFDDAVPDMYVYHEEKIAPGRDLDFIAAARNYMPSLLAEIRRLRNLEAAD